MRTKGYLQSLEIENRLEEISSFGSTEYQTIPVNRTAHLHIIVPVNGEAGDMLNQLVMGREVMFYWGNGPSELSAEVGKAVNAKARARYDEAQLEKAGIKKKRIFRWLRPEKSDE